MDGRSDGIEESAETHIAATVVAVGRVVETAAQILARRDRVKAEVNQTEAQRLAQRFEGERQAATAAVSLAGSPQRVAGVRSEELPTMLRTAKTWSSEIPGAGETAALIERNMRERLTNASVYEQGLANADRAESAALRVEAEQVEKLTVSEV
jgi:hypothetical protein